MPVIQKFFFQMLSADLIRSARPKQVLYAETGVSISNMLRGVAWFGFRTLLEKLMFIQPLNPVHCSDILCTFAATLMKLRGAQSGLCWCFIYSHTLYSHLVGTTWCREFSRSPFLPVTAWRRSRWGSSGLCRRLSVLREQLSRLKLPI